MNPNSFVLGVPGAGKSFIAKELIVFLMLSTDDDIIICDPERECASLIEALGGEVITVSASSPHRINALDMVEGFGDGGNPVADKSEFVLSLFEHLDAGGLGAQERSIIDRCTALVYADARGGGGAQAGAVAGAVHVGVARHLCAPDEHGHREPHDRLRHHGPRAAALDHGVARHHRRHAQPGDGELASREEHPHLHRRVPRRVRERALGRLLQQRVAALPQVHAYPTALTQNIEYLLDAVLAFTRLLNSELVVMLNQAPSDRQKLSRLLNISPEQMGYVTNAEVGCGLLRYGSALVPFVNRFPKDTELYRVMTTKPGE